ncbi:MAG: RIP metalloprotease RseP [Bacilli bacterium]|nr:RIP metalloprotease RseP [Bacilli bacterium]
MQVLMTILYILLFIVFLSVLIIVHECGHLIAAKIFKVYCLEYSIGMGPLLFKFKRKKGETQFSLRAIPFGGYVSMYGEGVELPEGVTVDESRSLNGIKAWKRAIVLLAGVTMNAVLAIVLFFITNCFNAIPHKEADYINHVNVSETALVTPALPDETYFKVDPIEYTDSVANVVRTFYVVDLEATFDDNITDKYAACFNFGDYINPEDDLDLSKFIYFYELKEEIVEGDAKIVPDFEQILPVTSFTNATIHVIERIPNENDGSLVDGDIFTIQISQVDGELQPIGISVFSQIIQYNFGEIIAHTFSDFGRSSIAIFQALGNLFTKPSSWSEVGGIIAIGYETTAVLKSSGFLSFLRIWGLISVNLAIFNLLPFPGLDGWQLLVLIVEGCLGKKIPEKVKNIISLIGIGLLLVLMVGIIFKDLFTYVFAGIRLL